MNDKGSWFNYYWTLNWKRSLLWAALITGLVYFIVIDWNQFENDFVRGILVLIASGWTLGAFYLDWKLE